MKRVLLSVIVALVSMASFGQLISDGTYTIQNVGYTGYLCTSGGIQSAGGKVCLSTTPNQKWTIKHIGNDVYQISLLNTSVLLDVTDALQANNAKIQVWNSNGNTAQNWKAVSAGNGNFYFQAFGGNGRNLDAPSATAQIITWDANGGTNQRWKLRAVPAANRVATFYSNCNYGGNAVNLPAGNYTLAQLQGYGISNDDIDALRVAGGYTVTLFADDNFGGDRRSFTADYACLIDAARFENRTTSLKIEATSTLPATVAIVYPNCNYSGYPVSLSAGSYTLAQLQAIGINNDDIDALRVAGGYTVTLYADNNFSGDRRSFTTDFACLIDAAHFENRTTSLKIEATSTLPATVATFYPNCNYSGYGVSLAKGVYTLAQLKAVGINNDDIESLRVSKGYRVFLYSEDNGLGDRRIIPFDYSCLYNANLFDNKTTSLIVDPYTPVYGAATVYGDCNYGGYAVSLPEGVYNRDDLIVWGVAENTISSVKVTPGYRVDLYERPFGGPTAYIAFEWNAPCLADPDASFNDVTSSLSIRWTGGTSISRNGEASSTHLIEKGGFETAGSAKTVVSPNPASAVVTVNYTSEAAASVTVEIAGAAGNVVERKTQGVIKGLNRLSLDVSKLANGTYFVIISNNGKKENVKLVVQH